MTELTEWEGKIIPSRGCSVNFLQSQWERKARTGNPKCSVKAQLLSTSLGAVCVIPAVQKALPSIFTPIMSMSLDHSLLCHVWAFTTTWTVAHQAPPVHGIRQARILEWVATPFSRGSSWSRDRSQVSCTAGRFFTVWATRKALYHSFSSVQSLSRVQLFVPHELQHARPPCASPTPGVYSNSSPSSQWCHPAISSSVVPFSSCPQSLPASGSFLMGVSHDLSLITSSLFPFLILLVAIYFLKVDLLTLSALPIFLPLQP